MRAHRFPTLMGIALLLLATITPSLADGTETLGAPLGLVLESGDEVVAAGIGTFETNGGTIEITLPTGDIKQVIAYWGGEEIGNQLGDDSILLDGTPILGTDISGPAFFFNFDGNDFYYSAFRADVTGDVALVAGGLNFVDVGDMDYAGGNSGAGLVVIMDTGGNSADIELRDGVDLAFGLFPEPRKSMIPQTFEFPAATVARTVDLVVFAGSVGEGRPNVIDLNVDGVMSTLINPLGSNDGELWDTLSMSVNVPANEGAASSMITILPVSRDDTASGELIASLVWIGAGVTVPAVCGDGELDDGEECDDGNSVNDDECRNDCTIPRCGDGNVDPNEECDDGNDIDDDECRNDCTIPVCGDGIVDADEDCDDGNDIDDDECRNDCTIPVCGDGIVDADEDCDDGNMVDDDECRNDCTIPVCGDGILDDGEDCDDGNNDDGDGCNADCTNELGQGCTPGYWKQEHHWGNWDGYTPGWMGDHYIDVFGVPASFGNITLSAALWQGGGGEKALGRHATAALLNASSSELNYPYTEAGIIAIVQDAYASGNYNWAKNALAFANQTLDCPLERAELE